MKTIFLAIAISAFVFSSCRHNSSESSDTHTHEDGTVHSNHSHSHSEEDMPQQEVFEVEIDSLSQKTDSMKQQVEHSHNGGHTHKH